MPGNFEINQFRRAGVIAAAVLIGAAILLAARLSSQPPAKAEPVPEALVPKTPASKTPASKAQVPKTPASKAQVPKTPASTTPATKIQVPQLPKSDAPQLKKSQPGKTAKAPAPGAMTMASFLDRLMLAESNGRDLAANPRSTALGPFQFIRATFLGVARRHFAAETAKLTDVQILALRTNRAFARKAAKVFTQDNAQYLADRGVKPTFTHLRLAFLLGAASAVKVLRAKPPEPLSRLLSPAAIKANPFMARMRAADLIARAARDLKLGSANAAGLSVKPGLRPKSGLPAIKVNCNLGLASCRRWLTLRQRKQKRLSLIKARKAKP